MLQMFLLNLSDKGGVGGGGRLWYSYGTAEA